MTESIETVAVRKSVRVQAEPEHAFHVFVDRMETWWPATHHIGKVPFAAIFVEPRVGGKWYEVNAQGDKCEWGTVLTWEPPSRVAFSWHLGPGHDSPDWTFNPDMDKASRVEIRFTDEGSGMTLVELEHSNLERHGEGYRQLQALFDGPGAWSGILGAYADRVKAGEQ